jgi:hypothetical protein
VADTFTRTIDKETKKLVVSFRKKDLVAWIEKWHARNGLSLPLSWIIRLEIGAGNDGTIWTYDVHVGGTEQ